MYFAAKKPTIIIPIGRLPFDEPCPGGFKWAGCAACLPLRFEKKEFALEPKQPRPALSCGCFDCPQGSFRTDFDICIPNEISKFAIEREFSRCSTHEELKNQQQALPPEPTEEKDDIFKFLFPITVGMLGFMLLFFITKGRREK